MLKYFGIACGVCCICAAYCKSTDISASKENSTLQRSADMLISDGTVSHPNSETVADAVAAYMKTNLVSELEKYAKNVAKEKFKKNLNDESKLKLIGEEIDKVPYRLNSMLSKPSIESIFWLEEMCKTAWKDQKTLLLTVATMLELHALEYAYCVQDVVVSSVGQTSDKLGTSLRARMWTATVPIKSLVGMIRGIARDLLKLVSEAKGTSKYVIFAHSKISDDKYIENAMQRINNYVKVYKEKIAAGKDKDTAKNRASKKCLYTDIALLSKDSVASDLVPSFMTIQQMVMFPRSYLVDIILNAGIKNKDEQFEVGTNEIFNKKLETAYEEMGKILFERNQGAGKPQKEMKKRWSLKDMLFSSKKDDKKQKRQNKKGN